VFLPIKCADHGIAKQIDATQAQPELDGMNSARSGTLNMPTSNSAAQRGWKRVRRPDILKKRSVAAQRAGERVLVS
jgi:hypothetical protein